MNRRYVAGAILLMIAAALLYVRGDLAIERWFYTQRTTPVSHLFSYITELGKSHYFLVPAALLWLYARGRNVCMQLRSAYLFVTIAASGLLVDLIKILAGRCRPELYFQKGLYGFDLLHLDHKYLSFPSGHSATAIGAAVALSYLWPRYRVLFWIGGIMIAVSRLVVVRHYPSDVLIGGAIGGYLSFWLYRYHFQGRLQDAGC